MPAIAEVGEGMGTGYQLRLVADESGRLGLAIGRALIPAIFTSLLSAAADGVGGT